jgi:hypothetical protein
VITVVGSAINSRMTSSHLQLSPAHGPSARRGIGHAVLAGRSNTAPNAARSLRLAIADRPMTRLSPRKTLSVSWKKTATRPAALVLLLVWACRGTVLPTEPQRRSPRAQLLHGLFDRHKHRVLANRIDQARAAAWACTRLSDSRAIATTMFLALSSVIARESICDQYSRCR